MPTLTVHSQYKRDTTTVRPSITTDEKGRPCLRITRRAFTAAENRCAYAGTDGIDIWSIPLVHGYGQWHHDDDGHVIALRVS